MAPRPRAPVFLARAGYRQRRLKDAARFLPGLGVVLWMIPLLWPRGPEGGMATSTALIYIFTVWAGLIGAAWLISRRLRPDAGTDAPDEGDGR